MRLDIRSEPPVKVKDELAFLKIIRQGFQQRRKTLVNSLSSLYPKTELAAVLTAVGRNENIRAEELSLEDYARITNKLSDM
jgi:16S rRNA (adenine1518-N6/adenine1519-N6)-dimethyltransferase